MARKQQATAYFRLPGPGIIQLICSFILSSLSRMTVCADINFALSEWYQEQGNRIRIEKN